MICKSLFKVCAMFLLVAVLSLSSYGQPSVSNPILGTNTVSLSFHNTGITNTIEYTPSGPFASISINGCGTTSELGKPKLPIFRYDIEVPINMDVTLRVTDSTMYIAPVSAGGNIKVIPFQPSIERLPDVQPAFVKDATTYSTNAYIFSNVAKIVGERVVRNRKFVTIEVAFVNYNPVLDMLKICTDIKVSADFALPRAQQSQPSSKYKSKTFERSVRGAATSVSQLAPVVGAPAAAVVKEGYIIITPPEYQSLLTPFVTLKQSKYDVTVVTTTTTGSTTTSIKAYIQNAYNTWANPPVFILLVGDVDKIPYWTTSSTPTDLYYSTVQGTDYFPDIFVGRVSVSNSTQLTNWVNKVVKPQTLKKHSWIAGADQTALGYGLGVDAETDYCVATYFNPIGWTSFVNKVSVYGSGILSRVKGDLTGGVSILSYNGHGAWNAWIDGISWTKSDVDAQTNTMYPVIFSFGCNTGEYSQGECIGESWIRATNGATAFMGSTITSNWREDGYLGRGIYSAINQGFPTFAEIVNNGKHQVFLEEGNVPKVQTYYEQYNVLGDPSQEILRSDSVVVPPPPPSDTQAPVVSITSPAAAAVVSGTVTVSATATDNVGVTKVELYVNGVLAFTDVTSPYSFSWNTAGLSGQQILTAKAYDAAGNVTTSPSVAVSIYVVPPPPITTCNFDSVRILWYAKGLVDGKVGLWTKAQIDSSFTAGKNSVVCAPVGYTKAQLDSAFTSGKNSVVCPPIGYTKIQLDSAFTAGKNSVVCPPPTNGYSKAQLDSASTNSWNTYFNLLQGVFPAKKP